MNILECFNVNLQKSPPKSPESQNRPTTHKIASWGAILPRLKTTAVDSWHFTEVSVIELTAE